MDKGKIEAMVTKFLEKFAIIMLKKHRNFCRRGLTHLDATPIFKNRLDTYETPCRWSWLFIFLNVNMLLPNLFYSKLNDDNNKILAIE